MNSKLTRYFARAAQLIALAMVTIACAGAATSAASPAPPATPVTAETSVPDEVYLARAREALAAPTSTPAFWPTGMPPPTAKPAAAKPSPAFSRTECQRRGAEWFEFVAFGPNCQHYPTSDGGPACSSSSECEAAWCDANLTTEIAEEILEQAGGKPVFMTGTCPPIAIEVRCGRHTSVVEGGRLTLQSEECE